MKIALLHTALAGPSGGERQVLELAIQLQKQGHEVELFTNRVEESCFPELRKKVRINVVQSAVEKVRKEVIGHKDSKKSKFLKLFADWSNTAVMRAIGDAVEDRFDIINCHNFPSEWAAYAAKKRLQIPVVWMCNEPPFYFFNPVGAFRRIINWPLYHFWDRHAVSAIDKIVVLDYMNVKRVKQIYGREAEVVRSGLDRENLKVTRKEIEMIRKKHNFGKSFTMLVVGGFIDFKRPQDAIEACSVMVRKGLDAKLVIVGIGPLLEQCRELIKKLNIGDRVILAGRVSDRELSIFYNACDSFIFAAEQTWGLVAIEAMACRKPVIVSDRSGVSEVIVDGKTGFVFKSRNVQELAAKAASLINDKKLYKRVAGAGYSYAVKNISWEKYGKNMERIFRTVLAQQAKKKKRT